MIWGYDSIITTGRPADNHRTMTLYPLRFEPIFRRYVWGGRRLASVLGKSIGQDATCAESWEVVDRGDVQSVVRVGPLAGTTLHQVVVEHAQELFGRHHPHPAERFPLLFKFLDARQTLSVQVHPDDRRAAALDPPDLGKTEAWVVLARETGSLIYAGLRRGFDRHALTRELARGTCELCLHHFEPQPGDCVFLPAGVVHALGAGLLVAEIQQSSDATYRLYDWNRIGPDGRPRALHVERALEAIDYHHGPCLPPEPQPTSLPHVSRLVECDKFVLDRWQFDTPQMAGGDDRFHLLAVLEGSLRIAGDPIGEPLAAGGTALLPAACGAVQLQPQGRGVLLDIYLP